MKFLRKFWAVANTAKGRLFGRALVAGATVVGSAYLHTGSVTRAVIVGAVLAFAEIFTPLNPLIGFFKGVAGADTPAAPTPPAPAA